MNGFDWRQALKVLAATIAGLFIVASAAQEPERNHTIPFFPSASDEVREGFARVINHSAEAGEVRIDAVDDEGESYGPVMLAVDAGEAVHFNSDDLENGNAAKGLSGSVEAGQGAWRLQLSSELDIEVLSYIRTTDGFVTAMHDTVPSEDGGHWVAFFNPGSNTSQVSRLRLVNPGEEAAEVSIVGVDDRGESPGSEVTTTIASGASRTFTAAALESGGEGLQGALGDGEGKWRLTVESAQPLVVMSLLSDPAGYLTNLSTAPGNEAGSAHFVQYLPAASDALGRQGFVRVINHCTDAGEVRIDAFDDEGETYGPLVMRIGAGEAAHFNSEDLENGNAEKGLSDGVGAGQGAWRLQLSSELDIEVLSYVRTSDGFLTAMHDTAPSAGGRHRVAFFNPGGNASQVSRLRLVNPGEEEAEVSIAGVDDRGESPGSEVTTTIPAGASRTYTAAELESGDEGLEGSLGDGEGKWRLTVESSQPLVVMSLLSDPMGYLTNLSTAPGREPQVPADLVVVAPSVSNNGPVAGAAFTLSATVRNDGDASAPVTVLRYYRSSDATITTTDRAVGTDAVAGLAASGSASESVELTAPSTPGTYYYGACVDAVAQELDTTNNCSTSVEVDVQESELESRGQPDLVVAPPTVSDDGPAAGTTFILSVTVSNAGDGTAPSAMMRYYRSSDATITTSDTPAGTDEVAELGVSGSGSRSVELTAPSTPGTYYYGACVDAVTKESDTTNNCSTSVEVNVPKSEPQSEGEPDLSVPALSAATSPGGTYTGDAFTVSATVRNDGDGDAAATTLRYYRSSDATITTADTEVGTDDVAALAASASGSESVDLTAPSTPGTYYYGACVDAVTEESDTTNNCSTSLQIDVLDPQRPPDLVVGSPTVNDSGPVAGETFTLSATVRNDGDGDSAATTLRYYRSADTTITTADTEVGTDAVAVLAASASTDESVDLTAPSDAGAYYYGACVDEVAEESDTTNNCSTSVKVDVEEPEQPDLEVGTPTVDDTSPETGATFTLSATVSNTGDAESAATTLRYYRSTDSTISSSDTQVGTDTVGALAASGTSAESISLTASSTAGTYYYGACVDAVTDESDTTNNCSSSVTIAVEELSSGQPDLRIVGVSTGTPLDGVGPGTLIQFSANVRNYGDANSDATTLRYYRSTDATISVSDTEVGTDEVSALVPSRQVVEGIDLHAPLTAGTYYYGACVDAVTNESDTTNNCSGSVPVTVPEPEPDLVVGSPTVSDSSPTSGASFTLSATVRNAGGVASSSTTLRYYRSTDATITTADTSVGTDAVGALAAAGSSSESTSLTAPLSPGTYYYGACVDTVTDESDTTNNCSLSVTVTVPEPEPDLVVGSPTVSDSSPTSGASFTLSATVRNAGGAASSSTTLRYYRSTDATITTSDTSVGTDAVGTLAAAGTSSESTSLTAPSTAGTYYYGACVDTVTDESDTTNNCSGSVQVDVQEPAAHPDLTVTLSITLPGGAIHVGSSFRFGATVRNVGEAASDTTTLRFQQSGTEVATDAVEGLASAGATTKWAELTAPLTPGRYSYNACVDAVAGESNTTNNCSLVSIVVNVLALPDLEVGSPSVSDDSPETGGSFTLSATVTNSGDGASAATTLRYYRSADATISSSDTQVGTDALFALAAGGTSDESVALTAPSTAGTYYYGACVDAVTGESSTTNNCSSSVTVTVTEPEPQPDLVVDSFTITLGPTLETSPGALVKLNQRVANVGDAASAATTVRYYRSTDATITTSDTQVSTDAVPELAASSRFVEAENERLPTAPGTYYYGACVDAVAGESNTANNCSRSVKVTVPEPQPDLVVGSASVDDSNLNTGDSFTLSATVRNAGDEQSAASTLRYYRSTDSTISSSDTQIGTDAAGALAAAGTSAESISLTAPSTAGTYYYGACVDEVTDESDTTNNCSSSVTIAVEEESSGQPDLRIVGVSAGTPLDGVGPGTRIQFSANVRNYGDANSDATTLRYYRSTDATISVSDTEVGTDEVSALVPSRQVVEGIDLTAPSTTGTYYYGACVDAVTDESDTTNNCSGVVVDHGGGVVNLRIEPYRVSRRLQTLRDWSVETFKQILPGAPGTGSAVGPGPPGRARLAMVGYRLGVVEDRVFGSSSTTRMRVGSRPFLSERERASRTPLAGESSSASATGTVNVSRKPFSKPWDALTVYQVECMLGVQR